MSGLKPLDTRSKLGRAVFSLVDQSHKSTPDNRGRVARIRNLVEASPDDAMIKFKINADLDVLAKDPRLASTIMLLRKALPS